MTTPALTPQQRAPIIAAAYRRPVIEALRCAEQRRADERLARDPLAWGARVDGTVTLRRDFQSAGSCRALVPGSAANQIEERAARP